MSNSQKPYTDSPYRFALPILGAVLLVIVFALGNYAWDLPQHAKHWWADGFWTLSSLAAALSCFWAAKGLPRPQHIAWLLFGAGCAAWFVGMLIWDYYELVLGQSTPFPAPSDFFFLLMPLLFIIGFAIQFSGMPTTSLTSKTVSDIGIIVTSVVIVVLTTLAEPLTSPELTTLYKMVSLSLPVVYFSAFIFGVLQLARFAFHPAKFSIALLTGSIAVHAITNTFYAYSLLIKEYQVGHIIDVFWIIAFMITLCAAAVQRGLATSNETQLYQRSISVEKIQSVELALYTATLLIVSVVAFAFRDQLHVEVLGPVLLAVIVLVLFLGLREWANYRIENQLAREVRASEHELKQIFHSMQDTYFRVDRDGRIERLSDSIERLLGYPPQELTGQPISRFYFDETAKARCFAELEQSHGNIHNYEVLWHHRDGSAVWVSLNAQYTYDSGGKVTGAEGIARDVSEEKMADAEMLKLSTALQQTAESVIITNREGTIEFVNSSYEKITGYTRSELLGKTPSIVKSGKHDSNFYKRLWDTILSGNVFTEVFINKRKDDSFYYEAKTITPLSDSEGNITHFISTGKDITDQIQDQEKMRFLAHHDPLTELPNRTLFMDRVEQAMRYAHWHSRYLAIMFIDLDRFKYINDSLGHSIGDQMLIEIGRRLKQQVRDRDTVARFGGDEFVVLLEDVASQEDITDIADKILNAMQPPVYIKGMELHVTASLGISLYPTDGDDAQTLLKNADGAMYRAKETGKNTFKFYSDDMSERAYQRLTLENHLRHALERGEFELVYQPQYRIASGEINGAEALLRWNHPEFGMVQPSDFISLLEETGLIIPVGEWVIRTACQQVKAWAPYVSADFRMGINISARQLAIPDINRGLNEIFDECGISPRNLQFEMTESIFMHKSVATNRSLKNLRSSGISLAIDDFGTGYSSLSYLKRFPIDTLKIDRSFIRDVTEDPDDAALTMAIISMAHSLGLEVIAEGVEQEAQRQFLLEHGCEYLQGYLFSKPVSARSMTRLLRECAEQVADSEVGLFRPGEGGAE